jgi:Peptidase propeptide and YPEB domain
MTNLKLFAAVAALGMTLISGQVARAEGNEAELDAATTEKVTMQLTADGYDVRRLEVGEGAIEAYVVKDGATMTLLLDVTDFHIISGNE